MSWPSPQEYNEAIQTPKTSFEDSELKLGQPELTVLGLPRPMTGAFASVYRFHCKGKDWAVRCFLRDVRDIKSRYSQISRFIMTDELPYTVSFDYIEKGIRVNGQWFPILKMEWVEGQSLDQYIHQNFRDKDKMRHLSVSFQQMVADLRAAGIAHGDLQHGNIMVVGNELRLVDYDGMYVPGLKGRDSNELGHRNYQHPSRTVHDFGPYLDNFSSWVIMISLMCFAEDPDFWLKISSGEECLLFKQMDYQKPFVSRTFFELENHKNNAIKNGANLFRHILEYPLPEVPPFSFEIVSPAHLPPLKATGKSPVIEPISCEWTPVPERFFNVTSGLWDSANMQALAGEGDFTQNTAARPASSMPASSGGSNSGASSGAHAGGSAQASSSWQAGGGAHTQALVWAQQGFIQVTLGNLQQANRYFEKALEIEDECAEAFYGRALILLKKQERDSALTALQQATHLKPDYFEAYESLGWLNLELKNYTTAKVSFDRCIQLNPNVDRAYYGRALCLTNRKQYQDSLQDFTAAIKLNSREPEYLYGRADALLNLKRPNEARLDFTEAIRLNPKLVKAWRGRARASFAQDMFPQALFDYNKALDVSDGDDLTYYERGLCRQKMGGFKESISDFQRAIALKPKYVEAYLRLGVSQCQLGEWEAARQAFDAAIASGASIIPPDIKPLESLARGIVLLQSDDADPALTCFNSITSSSPPKELDLYRAIAFFKKGEYLKAYGLLEKARDAGCNPTEVLAWQAACDLELGNIDESNRKVEEVLRQDTTNPVALTLIGKTFLKRNDIAKAKQAFDRAIRADAKNVDAYLGKGICFELENEANLAIHEYDSAIRFVPKRIEPYLRIGNLYNKKRQWADALRTLDVAVKMSPTNVEALLGRAMARFRSGDDDRAVADVKTALQREPRNARALCYQGILLIKKSRLEEAARSFEKGLEFAETDDQRLEIYLARSELYELQGQSELAESDCQRVLALQPDNAVAFFKRGVYQYKRKVYLAAVLDLTEAIKLDPTNDEAHLFRGRAHKEMKELDKAIADFTAAIKWTRNVEAYEERAHAYREQAELKRALVDVDAVIQIKGTSALSASSLKGLMEYELKDYAQAKLTLQKAIKFSPMNAEAHFFYALACCQLGKPEQAGSSIEKAIKLSPALGKRPEASLYYRSVGDMLLQEQNHKTALKFYEQGLKANPQDAQCRKGIAEILHYFGDYGAALKSIQRASEIDPNTEMLFIEGSIRLAMEEYEPALACFNTILQADPNHDRALIQRSLCHIGMENFGNASDDLMQIDNDALRPDDYPSILSMAMIHYKLQGYDEVRSFLQPLLAKGIRKPEIPGLLGLAKLEQGLYKEAAADLKLAIAWSPELFVQTTASHTENKWLARFYSGRGTAQFHLKKLAKAVCDFEDALRFDANLSDAHFGLGLVANAKKKYGDAIEHFSKAIELASEEPSYYQARASAYSKLNEYEKSAKDYKTAEDLLALNTGELLQGTVGTS